MLNLLKISHFAIAESLEISFENGLTVLSGETGAGKSIMLDALGLILGNRADTSMVRAGTERADISAIFGIKELPEAIAWLKSNELDEGEECIVRRTIAADGRSRAFINGQPSPLSHLKALGEHLVDLHGQHEHQSLLKKAMHRQMLDAFAGLETLSREVKEHFASWSEKQALLDSLINGSAELEARVQLLKFQVEEFDVLALQEGEVEQLESELKLLSNSEKLIQSAQLCIETGERKEQNIHSELQMCLSTLAEHHDVHPDFAEAHDLFNQAQINVSEAISSLQRFADQAELNPERLEFVEERLSTIYQLARKHRCEPNALNDIHFQLTQELERIDTQGADLENIQKEASRAYERYLNLAESLRANRKKAAVELQQDVAQQLASLEMGRTQFVVGFSALEERQYGENGLDTIEFLVSANPGQAPKPIIKVASGGELSRISLAIQVIIAKNLSAPTILFDEVDSGIGGGTAERVGILLRELAQAGQVICVTHLPQVAAQGQQHLFVSKRVENDETSSQVSELSGQERVEEIARMLGGIDITAQTRAHAKEMLGAV